MTRWSGRAQRRRRHWSFLPFLPAKQANRSSVFLPDTATTTATASSSRTTMMTMRKERVVLTLVYLLLGTALALIARFTPLASSAASILLAVLWLGFLLAISFMETWVKFRAPFPPHHFGVDVGRTVYRALHAVERGLVLGLWLVHVVGSPHITTDTSFALLITLKLLVVVQHRMLFPKVELRAQHELYNALKVTPVEEMDHKARQELDSIQERVQTMPLPSTVYRVAYGIAEVSKMALLTVFAFEYLTRISDE